jgi:hypothetical protein
VFVSAAGASESADRAVGSHLVEIGFLRSEVRSVDSIAVSMEKLSELPDDPTAASLGTLEFASVYRT